MMRSVAVGAATFALASCLTFNPASADDGVVVYPSAYEPSVNLEARVTDRDTKSAVAPQVGTNRDVALNTRTIIPSRQICGTVSDDNSPVTCRPPTPAEAAQPAGEGPAAPAPPTHAQIQTAVREVPMPALGLVVQPGERTLVGVATTFHTRPEPLERTVELLGTAVRLEATPVRFTWYPGDGTSRTTTSPGRPYPADDVTHTYTRAAERVTARVDTTYAVRYRIGDGGWVDLAEPLTAAGPTSTFRVDEAAPVLTRP